MFNPISVWCGYGPDGDLRVILYDISNTFGQRHLHLHEVAGLDPAGNARHVFAKELFVSPFIDMDATYEFRMRPPDERAALLIREHLPSGHLLTATFVATRTSLTSRDLWQVFASHPLMTLKVISDPLASATTLVERSTVPPARRGTGSARHDRRARARDRGGPMSTIDRRALQIVCGRTRSGSITVRLPDGTTRRFEGTRPGPHAEVDVHDLRVVRRLIATGAIGLADGWIAGEFDSPNLTSVIELGALHLEPGTDPGCPGRWIGPCGRPGVRSVERPPREARYGPPWSTTTWGTGSSRPGSTRP